MDREGRLVEDQHLQQEFVVGAIVVQSLAPARPNQPQ